ncbi:MAG: secondary thiamine-phosphate synthase enzyme YjbQ [Actinomycetota bacterium]|jgi:secondary thiamine-phosphate synthase enzyme
MKSYRKEITIETPHRRDYVNITRQVEQCLIDSGIREGLVLVNSMHITSSVFINDDESGLHHDFEIWLEKLAPEKPHSQYRHNGFEDNADAHMKRQLMGREVVVAVTNGKLDFGTWEQIFYGEYDGKRKKRILVKIIGE